MHVCEQGEQRAPEASDIGDEDWLRVTIKLGPSQLFDQFFHRADAARQSDESVGAVKHRLLTFVHILDDQHLLDSGQRMLLADKEGWDDASDIAAGRQRRPGEASHQPFAAATVNKADPVGREHASEFFRRLGEPRIRAVARSAIDANVSNRAHVSICRPWPSAVKPGLVFKSDLAQDLGLMLAERWRTAVKRKRVVAHQDGTAKARRSLWLDPHAARLELRIFEK